VDVQAWVAGLKERCHLPQYVVIVQGDNELLIDTHHAFSLALLQAELAKRGRLTLKEYLFTPGNRFVADEQGSGYANEIVLPLKTVAPAKPTALLPADPAGGVRRKFPLGSEWLFVKIYAGEKITETLLLQCIRPLVRQLEAEGLIDQWFFVRYADPEPHLRLRFHGASDPHFFVRIVAAINAIGEAYVQNHVILRVQYDTYNREVERYGEKTIAYCEELFHCDSEAVLDLIEPFAADDGAERQRWLVGLRGVDELLNDAGYSLDDKLLLMDGLQQRFLAEFGDGPDLGRQLNQKYRQESAAIGEALGGGTGGALGFFLPVFGRRSEKQAPLLRTIRYAYGPQTLQMLVPSFIHMYLNRLFFANQRAYELVIYHFLRKHYASTLARRKPAA
jgi:thiopeptide-type bacteriocin biosynthesis protein